MFYTKFSTIATQPPAVFQSISQLLCLALALASGFSHTASAQQIPETGKVVVLFHTADFSEFKQGFGSGLTDYLNNIQDDISSVRITYEFLGLNYLPLGAIPDVTINLLKQHQQVDPATAVISVLSPTSEFLLDYSDELYTDIPIVHMAPNLNLSNRLQAQGLQNTAIIPSDSQRTVDNTLALIPELLPDTRHLYVISGLGEVSLEFVENFETSLATFTTGMEITFLSGLPVAELGNELSNLPENSAIILLSYTLDRNGMALNTTNVLHDIVNLANAPIFSPIPPLNTEGVVGGSFPDPALSGRIAGELVLALLSGRETSDILSSQAVSYKFDQAQLRRWGIDEDLLPPGSIIENQQATFSELYGQQLVILLLVTGVLLFFVAFFRRQATVVGTQKTLLESVINSITDAIFIADMDGKIITINKGAEELAGYSEEELLGKFTNELRDNYLVRTNDENSSDDSLGLKEPAVLKFKKKNGEIISCEALSTRITSQKGEVLGNISLIRDISKRLSLEEEQRQGQKMEALGNLVGGISHDFNNILGVISGYAELSLVNKEPSSFEANQSQILKATERAKSLVSQIMTFSRDTNIAQSSTDLAVLLDETMKLIKVSIPSNINIELKKGEGVHPVMGSAVQLQQIILNLTTNAYQAMKSSGGSISISLDRKQIDNEINLSHGVLAPGHYSVLAVSDNGPGMSKAVASRIFEPYFTTKAQGEGSGMGMAIVYNLVKSHDAMLNLETAMGEGTCVSLYFKEAADVSEAHHAVNTPKMAQGNGERILLVDDEADLLDATQKLLSGIGYQIRAFSKPGEALEAFIGTPEEFDLLVSDQSMPEMTGIQLISEIRKLNPDFPAIICTGYSDVIDQKDISHLALNGILRKPYKLAELAEILRGVLPD